MQTALSFNDVNFSPVEHNSQVWLTASELARALGYAKSDAIAQIYERNKDEFNSEMTTTLKMSVVRKTGTVDMCNRIFSPRGCHLITFFARTSVAKEFRRWVLDVLDKEIGLEQPRVKRTTKDKRTALHEAFALLMTKSKYLSFVDCYAIVHQRFGVRSLDEIPEEQLPEAVKYVHGLIGGGDAHAHREHNAYGTAHHMLYCFAWWQCFGEAIRGLNPTVAYKIHDHFSDGAIFASSLLGAEKSKELTAQIKQTFPYHLSTREIQQRFRS